ncbi:MAG TPA: hydrogen peroxide-dependent heme synthase [Terriglobales bacterium]|nr:hydrogen peroxide-dependent heme synthase [Terriglobales bacterium]
MRPESKVDILAAHAGLPALPLTLEGSSVLHQMMRVRWAAWKKLSPAQKKKIVAEAVKTLAPMEQQGESALYSVLGHKADLIFVHFRSSFEELKAAELRLSGLELWDLLEPAGSYLSVIELGLYDSTVKLYRALSERGVEPNSEEWKRETEEMLAHQREAMRPRLFPRIPENRYLSFYPMDRKRGEEKNWYTLPIQERQRQMAEHGEVGRRYAGQVKQIISGSIGFDDWEWGVDLFADDPLVFKKLIYEMRFDEVSAVYAAFGAFYVGVRCPVAKLGDLLSGKLPKKE